MYSVVILCGGKSTRMGRDKKMLNWDGESLLARILRGFPDCDDLFLSANEQTLGLPKHVRVVNDLYPDCGPLAGLHASLLSMKHDVLFAVSCDAPLIDHRTADFLYPMLGTCDAIVPKTADGRIHPLAALYRREAGKVAENLLRHGEYRLRTLLTQINTVYVAGELLPHGALTLANMNTAEDIRRLEAEIERMKL